MNADKYGDCYRIYTQLHHHARRFCCNTIPICTNTRADSVVTRNVHVQCVITPKLPNRGRQFSLIAQPSRQYLACCHPSSRMNQLIGTEMIYALPMVQQELTKRPSSPYCKCLCHDFVLFALLLPTRVVS